MIVISQVLARRLVLLAAGLAVYAALITAASIILGDDFISWTSWLDVAIFLGLAFGVYRKSRACAIALLVYHVANRAAMYQFTSRLDSLVGIVPLTNAVVFALGIFGTFAQRGAAERDGHAMSGRGDR